MASARLFDHGFPNGTTVEVFPANARAGSGPPSGSAVTSAVVTNGALDFAGLAEDVRYVAYALGRGVGFMAQPALSAGIEGPPAGLFARVEQLEELTSSVESNVGVVAAGTGVAATDMATLQAALTTAGPKRLSRGSMYAVNAALLLLSDTDLDLNGATVQVAAGTTLNGHVFQAANRENVHVHDGTIDLNKANTTDPGADTAGAAIGFSASAAAGTKNCTVRRVTVKDGHRLGIVSTNTSTAQPNELTVEGCKITGCVKRGVYVTRPSKLIVRGNHLSGNCTSDSGGGQIQASTGGSNVTVEGNTCENAPAGLHHGMAFAFIDGLRVVGNTCNSNSTDTGGTDGSGIVVSEDCTNFTVTGNTCKGNGAMGITVDPKTAASETIKTTIGSVTGNVCRSNGSHGIYCQYAKGVAIGDNSCTDNNGSGIHVVSRDCTVSDNTCATNAVDGIRLSDSATATVMGNNRVFGNRLSSNSGADYTSTTTDRNDTDVGARRVWRERFGRMDAMTASTRLLTPAGGAPVGASAATGASAAFYLDPAEFGFSAKLRVRLGLLINSTAPASDFTLSLKPFMSPTGAAATVGGTAGADVSGSTVTVLSAAATANTIVSSETSDFAVPAAGWYCLAIVNGSAMAPSSAVQVQAAIQVLHV